MSKRRVLSFILVLSMVLGSISMAFAAPKSSFKDIEDADVAKAVERLKAFEIVHGYEDGTYKPEQGVTREEFAKLLVETLGLGKAAEAAIGYTDFPDVAASRWSAGYVNVAAGQGTVIGYPDGTFGPENTVTYAESLTMIVRALGYKDEWLTGNWPGNFVAKAAELDITKNVGFTSMNGDANRGTVAIMLNNALDTRMVKQVEYGGSGDAKYEEAGYLLKERLKIDKIKNAQITSIPRVDSGLSEDEVKADKTREVIMEDFDYNYLLGLTADIYIDSDGDILYYEVKEKESTVYYDVIEEIDEDEAKLTILDDEVDLAKEDDLVIYFENKDSKLDDFKDAVEDSAEGIFAKIVLNKNNKVEMIDAFDWNELNAAVVVDVDETTLECFDQSEDTFKYDLAEEADNYYVFSTDFKQMDIEDVVKDDVVYVSKAENRSTGDDELYVVVVGDVVEGTIDRYYGIGGDSAEIRVDGKYYDVTSLTTVTSDNDDNIENAQSAVDKFEDLTDDKANVVLIKDITGKARHIRSSVKDSLVTGYGIFERGARSLSDQVKIYTAEGKSVSYTLDADWEEWMTDTDDNRYLVKYEINSDGEIDEIEKLATLPVGEDDLDTNAREVGSSRLVGDKGKAKLVKSNAVVFNLTDYEEDFDNDDIEIITWEDVVDADPDEGELEFIWTLDKNDRVEALFIFGGLSTVKDDVYAGYITKVSHSSDKTYVDIAVYGDKVKELRVKSTEAPDLDEIVRRQVAIFKLDNDGYMVDAYIGEEGSLEDIELITNAKITEKSGNMITIDDVEYKLDSNTVVYEKGDSKGIYNVSEGKIVDIAVDLRNGNVLAVKLHED